MIVSAIVAVSKNGIIGVNNQIPWYLSGDLRFFKKTTIGHHVIMGRKSFESIGRPLPKRTNIIISRNLFLAVSGCLVAHSIEEALEMAFDNGEQEAFIIGGGQIYSDSMPYWDKLYLTEVDTTIAFKPMDEVAYFPEVDWNNWIETNKNCHEADEKNDFNWCVRELTKKEPKS